MGSATRGALRGAIRALCPAEPALPNLEDRVEDHIRRMLRYMPKAIALGFCINLHLLDWAPVWCFVAPRRLRTLDKRRAELLLTELGESRSPIARMLVLGARGLILSTYFDQDEIHAALDYAPLPFLEERVALRERLLAGGASTEADLIGSGHLPKTGGVATLPARVAEGTS